MNNCDKCPAMKHYQCVLANNRKWQRENKKYFKERAKNTKVAGFTSGNKRSLKRAKPRIKRVR